jgi:hypothetical protein
MEVTLEVNGGNVPEAEYQPRSARGGAGYGQKDAMAGFERAGKTISPTWV